MTERTPDLNTHQRLEEERKATQPDARDIVDFRRYYRGRHKSTLNRDQGRVLRGLLGHIMADNICRLIVNSAAARHELLRWNVEADSTTEFLEDLWVRNAVSRLQADAAVATVRDGTHAIALNWHKASETPGDGRVTLHREPWWDGTSGVWIAYGGDGEPTYAVKEWEQTDYATLQVRKRRVLFYPDHLERWVLIEDGWKPSPLPGEDSTGIVPWVKRDGSPLGIPVVALYANSDDDTPYGASLLDGGVLGLQDEINDVQRDITATARYTGYQMYWATGTEPELDTAGNPKPLSVGPGQTLQSGNPNAAYGTLPAGDLTQLKGALMTKIEAACRVTDTPLHVITGDWPSGAALLRAEMPQISGTNKWNKTESPQWATIGHRACEMRNTFGAGTPVDEISLITAVWAPPERLDALTMAEIAMARLAVGTDRQALSELGYSEQEVDAIVADRESQKQKATEAFATAFNTGDVADEPENEAA